MDLTLERMIPQLETSDLPESYFLMLHSTCNLVDGHDVNSSSLHSFVLVYSTVYLSLLLCVPRVPQAHVRTGHLHPSPRRPPPPGTSVPPPGLKATRRPPPSPPLPKPHSSPEKPHRGGGARPQPQRCRQKLWGPPVDTRVPGRKYFRPVSFLPRTFRLGLHRSTHCGYWPI